MKKHIMLAMLVALTSSTAFAQDTDFASLDSDSDGKVSVAEFKTYVESKLPGFDRIDQFVKMVDADKNEEISEAEFNGRMEKLAAVQEMQEGDENSGSDEPKKEFVQDEAAIKAASDAYSSIGDLIEEKKWEQVGELMTDEAVKDFCFQNVMMGLAVAEMDLPMEIPGLVDAKDAAQEVVDVYGLDKLGLDPSSIMKVEINMGDEGDDKEKSIPDGDSEKTKDQKQIVLEHLDKDGKRWEIVGALWKAQSGSPFMLNPIAGEIDDANQEDTSVFLTIKMTPSGDAGIQIQAPPTVIKMEKGEEGWQYAGRDSERSQKLMKEFMKKMEGMRGGRRTDF